MARKNTLLMRILLEAARIGVIIAIVDWRARRRHAIFQKREDLVSRMGCGVKRVGLEAVQELRAEGWLTDGTLRETSFMRTHLSGAALDHADLQRVSFEEARMRGANFAWADLTRAILRGANLEGTSFVLAQLEGTSFSNANLRGAVFRGAKMYQAHLRYANLHHASFSSADLREGRMKVAFLREAKLKQTDLRGANLYRADLQQASLCGAKLQGANLTGVEFANSDLCDAIFDETTILPDGSNWTPETDLTRFSNPAHPEFWRFEGPIDWASGALEEKRRQRFDEYKLENQEG